MTILDEELTETKNLIISLLEDLKEHGKHDKSLYVTAERSVETHFEHFENRMYNKIKDLLNQGTLCILFFKKYGIYVYYEMPIL